MRRLLEAVETEFAKAHGRVVAGGVAAVVAMGKLGGREMTASSDLDLYAVSTTSTRPAMVLRRRSAAGACRRHIA